MTPYPWLKDYLEYLSCFNRRHSDWNGLVPERWSSFAQGWLEEMSESMRGYDDLVREWSGPEHYL